MSSGLNIVPKLYDTIIPILHSHTILGVAEETICSNTGVDGVIRAFNGK